MGVYANVNGPRVVFGHPFSLCNDNPCSLLLLIRCQWYRQLGCHREPELTDCQHAGTRGLEGEEHNCVETLVGRWLCVR